MSNIIYKNLSREMRKNIKSASSNIWGGNIFYRKRSLEVWEEHIKDDPKYVERLFPKIIETALTKSKITTSEAERLLDMIKSTSIEDHLMVVSILKEKFKKRGNVHR